MMELRGWLKTLAVAAAGGAVTALISALLDPDGFTVKYHLGEGRLATMVLTGAATSVAGLFLQPPKRKNGNQTQVKGGPPQPEGN